MIHYDWREHGETPPNPSEVIVIASGLFSQIEEQLEPKPKILSAVRRFVAQYIMEMKPENAAFQQDAAKNFFDSIMFDKEIQSMVDEISKLDDEINRMIQYTVIYLRLLKADRMSR